MCPMTHKGVVSLLMRRVRTDGLKRGVIELHDKQDKVAFGAGLPTRKGRFARKPYTRRNVVLRMQDSPFWWEALRQTQRCLACLVFYNKTGAFFFSGSLTPNTNLSCPSCNSFSNKTELFWAGSPRPKRKFVLFVSLKIKKEHFNF